MNDQPPDRERLRAALAAAAQSTPLPAIARELGIAPTSVELWLRGTYPNDVGEARIAAAVAAWLRRRPAGPEEETVGALDRLVADARVLGDFAPAAHHPPGHSEESRMTATESLRPDQVAAARESLDAYLKANGVNIGTAAKGMNYSGSVVSEFLSGTYAGDVSEVARAATVWMDRDAEKRKAKRPSGYVATSIAEGIRGIVMHADRAAIMAAIVAPAGVGKTIVAKALRDQVRGVYVRADGSMPPREFLGELAAEIHGGRRPSRMTKPELLRFVVGALSGTGRVILVDEAHQLYPASIGDLRTIHDRTGVPIVLLGTAEILDTLDDRTEGRGQLSSRCLRYNVMDHVRSLPTGPDGGSSADARLLFTVAEVKAFFESMGMRLAKDALEMLWAMTCFPTYGTLRLAHKVAQIALGRRTGETITRDEVRKALYVFMGPDARDFEGLVKQILRHGGESVARLSKTA